jgi:hypothetical protein
LLEGVRRVEPFPQNPGPLRNRPASGRHVVAPAAPSASRAANIEVATFMHNLLVTRRLYYEFCARSGVEFELSPGQAIDSYQRTTYCFAMKTLLALCLLGLLPSILMADSIRCGSRIITRGSSSAELTAFCGDPTQVTKTSSYVGGVRGADGVDYGTTGEIAVEIWTYNFGPNQLMERVRIENGMVVQIDSLGYGYNEP